MKFNAFLIIFLFILKQISAECFEPVGFPSTERKIRKVACGKWASPKKNNNNGVNKLVGDDGTMFEIKFTCLENDRVLCNKAQRAFEGAGRTISNTLKLKEKITVNATFLDLCQGESELTCPIQLRRAIGLTAPNKLYSLLSEDDKLERIYPQALVKQFQFPDHPPYDEFDVMTFFNSKVPFHFIDDITPINPRQYDFEYIITHELLHGLGFYTLWDHFDEKSIIPPVVAINSGNDGKVVPSEQEPLTVKETIFDKFMIRLDDGTFISEYTKQIAQYFLDNINVTSFNEAEFIRTPQYQLMKDMLVLATTPNALGFLPHNSNNYKTDAVVLETTVPGGFDSGSSLSHVDLATYNDTSEFLMVFKGTPGRTLKDFVTIGGNYSGGVIGPKIKAMLESIGYATEEYPNPVKPRPFVNPSAPTTKSSAIPISAISSSVIFGQFYIMIFIIIILL